MTRKLPSLISKYAYLPVDCGLYRSLKSEPESPSIIACNLVGEDVNNFIWQRMPMLAQLAIRGSNKLETAGIILADLATGAIPPLMENYMHRSNITNLPGPIRQSLHAMTNLRENYGKIALSWLG